MILAWGIYEHSLVSFGLPRQGLILSACLRDHIRHGSDCKAE